MESTETPAIKLFKGKYHFLSNFYIIPIVFEGERYRSVEHAFQAAKTLLVHEREQIWKATSPGMAKKLGRQVTKREDWDTVPDEGRPVRVVVMKELLLQKFNYPVMRELMLQTDGAELIEGNDWHDQYWGDCYCPLHRGTPGENMLGKLHMEVREEIA